MITKFEQGAVTPLRGMVGFGFAMPGYAKLANGPDHFIDNLRALGVPVLELMGWMTIII